MKRAFSIAMAMVASLPFAQAQVVITPSTAADNGGTMSSGRYPYKTIDRSGLYDAETINFELDDLHDTTRSNQWGAALANQALKLTLPSAQDIDRVYLWNAVEVNTRGVQTCNFLFSTDGGSSYANPTNLSFSQGGSAVQTKTFAMRTSVTHVMLTNFVTWGDVSYINIAEIRFGRPQPTGQMQWNDWRVVETTNAITYDSCKLSAILAGTNADVTLYWEAGVVTNPTTHTGWDGSIGPSSESTGTITRTVTGLAEGTAYSYAFYATNSTHSTAAWTGVGTFKTLEGEVVAEYLFAGNSPSSSDEHSNATASNIVLGAGIPTTLTNNRIEVPASPVVLPLNFSGDDYFGFTLTIPANVTLNLTRFTYTYEEANSFNPNHALWSYTTGEITAPATRYTPPSLNQNNLYSLRTIVHDLTEAGTTFQNLSGTNIEFRLYMGDDAGSSGKQIFDDIRLYATDPTPPTGTVIIVL